MTSPTLPFETLGTRIAISVLGYLLPMPRVLFHRGAILHLEDATVTMPGVDYDTRVAALATLAALLKGETTDRPEKIGCASTFEVRAIWLDGRDYTWTLQITPTTDNLRRLAELEEARAAEAARIASRSATTQSAA